LGSTLQEQGLFAEALAALEQGHHLGSRRPDWGYPSAEWVKHTQRQVALDAKLPGIRDGTETPATAKEHLDFALVCQRKGLYGASARLCAGAFTAKPALETTLAKGHRYWAACVAALAGTGRGRDVPELGPVERARWRQQALDWLRADLALWADQLERSPDSRSALQG